mmetsp:Transcript_3858/g.6556  ORF Transcript_3858/g.6556 Transcript_3858/m.6556 type:complete len:81 (+) Transcript_3858:1117-1359(+)
MPLNDTQTSCPAAPEVATGTLPLSWIPTGYRLVYIDEFVKGEEIRTLASALEDIDILYLVNGYVRLSDMTAFPNVCSVFS